jgi:hypothetical protein
MTEAKLDPMTEAAEAAYAQLNEVDRKAVDDFCAEMGKKFGTIRTEKGLKSGGMFGIKSQREVAAKLYAFIKAKRESQTDTVPETKAAPKTIEAPTGSTAVIRFERVVNFYPAE